MEVNIKKKKLTVLGEKLFNTEIWEKSRLRMFTFIALYRCAYDYLQNIEIMEQVYWYSTCKCDVNGCYH